MFEVVYPWVRFKPNTHMLSALVKGQIRTNERMDREQTENAQER